MPKSVSEQVVVAGASTGIGRRALPGALLTTALARLRPLRSVRQSAGRPRSAAPDAAVSGSSEDGTDGTVNRRLLKAQGAYYLVTGVWPLVHFRSFTAVAGPKPDRFQTQTTGALFAAIGLALLAGDPRETGTRVLSGTSSAAAMLMDLAYLPRIRKIFLAEACVEAVFLAAALHGDAKDR